MLNNCPDLKRDFKRLVDKFDNVPFMLTLLKTRVEIRIKYVRYIMGNEKIVYSSISLFIARGLKVKAPQHLTLL